MTKIKTDDRDGGMMWDISLVIKEELWANM